MEFTAQQIADLLDGTVEGDANISVNSLTKIEEGKTGTLSFLANPQYTPHLYKTKASVVIVNKDFSPEKPVSCTLIKVADAYQSFGILLNMHNRLKNDQQGIHPKSHIEESASIGKEVYVGPLAHIGLNTVIGNNVKIHPQCFIGDRVHIGDNTILQAGVRIYADCQIGSNCILHAGVIIGGDGFGFAPNSANSYDKMAQIGNVVIQESVEIGANTTVDRATLGSTIIHKGVKLDNLIQVAHNVEIGENTVIAAQTGIAGSTKIGKNCMIGGQVGIGGHLTIADEVKIAAKAGIASSIQKTGAVVQGTLAFDIGDYKRSYVLFKKLPDVYKRLQELEKEIASLRQE